MTSEAAAQQQILLAASRRGVRLWRNNNGACMDADGRQIRYGLANTSAKMSKAIKSSDLIGITPHVVRPEDVGKTMGVFTSVECKRPGWVYAPNGREAAQQAWLDVVSGLGGIATFATCPEDVWGS